MTVEALLKPRYKVIADYPNSIYSIGEIIECDAEEDCTLHKWPAIFKKLHWSEDRKPEDMPQFIKSKDKRVWLIKEWRKDLLGGWQPINNIDNEGDTENFASVAIYIIQ